MTATSNGSLAQTLIGYIKAERLKAGDRLPSIRQLARRLKVRPTLLRDAVLQVQMMGLVKIEPRYGVFVRSVDFAPMVSAMADALQPALLQGDHNLFHLIDARSTIEIKTAGLAAARHRPEDLLLLHEPLEEMASLTADHARYADADQRFHVAIARVAGNTVLLTMLNSLMTLLHPYRMKAYLLVQDMQFNVSSHELLYDLIARRDVKAARAEMRRHIGHGRQVLLRSIRKTAAAANGKQPREKVAV